MDALAAPEELPEEKKKQCEVTSYREPPGASLMPSCPDEREVSQTEYQSTQGALSAVATKTVLHFYMKSE